MMENVQDRIRKELKDLERSRSIRILFASESGSRGWGFPSLDSDYDARFIYVHPLPWYLSINEKRDVIELPLGADLDINGWELRKALRLLVKRNVVLYEWLQSPIVYLQDDAFVKSWQEVAPRFFTPIAAAHHYLNLFRKCFTEIEVSPQVKLKKYMYSIRSILAALWIIRHKSVPPMELRLLLPMIEQDKQLVDKITSLVRQKSKNNEAYSIPRDKQIDDFLMASLAACEEGQLHLPSPEIDKEELNHFFRAML
jgi:predicted nucleotidyltransferase